MKLIPADIIPPKPHYVPEDTNGSRIKAGATVLKCGRCQITKPLENFSKSRNSTTGYTNWCKACHKEYRQLREQDPNTALVRQTKITERRYGCTYESLIEKYGAQCNICGAIPNKRLVIDHDHETKAIRGLLCDICNRGLGFFKDNPKTLQNAITYLKERT